MAEEGGDGRKGILPGNEKITIDAPFLPCNENEVYLFKKNECILYDYVDCHVVKGPLLICEMFPSLAQTPPFGERGIDCAFKIHHKSEAFIFCGIQCARLNFETPDKITKGPSTIASMFPFLVGTVFETGVDAAFESAVDNEAYLFKGRQCALINYSDSAPKLIASGPIIELFPSLDIDNTFKDGIDAAFATNSDNEVYIFSGIFSNIWKTGMENRNEISNIVKEIIKVWPRIKPIWSS